MKQPDHLTTAPGEAGSGAPSPHPGWNWATLRAAALEILFYLVLYLLEGLLVTLAMSWFVYDALWHPLAAPGGFTRSDAVQLLLAALHLPIIWILTVVFAVIVAVFDPTGGPVLDPTGGSGTTGTAPTGCCHSHDEAPGR